MPPVPSLPRIAVIIPSYRVGGTLLTVLEQIPAVVDHIYVVEDGCPDKSGCLAEKRCKDPRLRVLRHDKNRGVGAAMVTGYEAAVREGCDLLVKVDGDGQMDLGQLNRLVNPIIEGLADYTKGNRFYDLKALERMPLVRRWGNFALTLLAKAASGNWHISDPTNGYTALHRQAYLSLQPGRLAEDYFFETSMLVNLNIVRAVIVDIPIPARYGNETSSLSPGRSALTFPGKLWRSLLRRLFWRYYVYDINAVSLLLPLGLLLLGGGMLFGAYRWYLSAVRETLQSSGTVALALLPILLGGMLLLQALQMDFANFPKHPLSKLLNDRNPKAPSP